MTAKSDYTVTEPDYPITKLPGIKDDCIISTYKCDSVNCTPDINGEYTSLYDCKQAIKRGTCK